MTVVSLHRKANIPMGRRSGYGGFGTPELSRARGWNAAWIRLDGDDVVDLPDAVRGLFAQGLLRGRLDRRYCAGTRGNLGSRLAISILRSIAIEVGRFV